MSEHIVPDKQQVRASFERSAERYEEVAVLQREVGTRLLERLPLFKIEPLTILDLGCGTGFVSRGLLEHYPKARVISLDLAEAMLKQARGRRSLKTRLGRRQGFVCADAESLPFADNSFDLILSNMTVQWCGNLEATFTDLNRVLKKDGLLLYSTLGPDTLKELRAAWASVDGEHPHVNNFLDMHDVGDAMLRARLADPVMDREDIVITYREALTLMQDLKVLGAHNVNPGRTQGLTTAATLKRVIAGYESFRNSDGLLPATYEVLYGHAFGTPSAANSDITVLPWPTALHPGQPPTA